MQSFRDIAYPQSVKKISSKKYLNIRCALDIRGVEKSVSVIQRIIHTYVAAVEFPQGTRR